MTPYTDEIRMAGPVPEFGIEQDDTLQSAMEKIGIAFAKVEKMLDKEFHPAPQPITLDSIKISDDFFIGNGLSYDAKQFEGKTIFVEAVRQQQDVSVTFKTVDFDIPPGTFLASNIVNVSGQRDMGRTEITNTKNKEMTLSVGYNRFPVVIEARVVFTTPTGDVELRKAINISSEKDFAQATPYDVIDRTTQAKPIGLKGLLKQFEGRIKAVENPKK